MHKESQRANLPLSRNDDGLAHAVSAHRRISIFRDRKQMRLQLASPSSTVRLYDLGAIKRDTLKRVDRDQHDTAVSIDAMLRVSISDCVQN